MKKRVFSILSIVAICLCSCIKSKMQYSSSKFDVLSSGEHTIHSLESSKDSFASSSSFTFDENMLFPGMTWSAFSKIGRHFVYSSTFYLINRRKSTGWTDNIVHPYLSFSFGDYSYYGALDSEKTSSIKDIIRVPRKTLTISDIREMGVDFEKKTEIFGSNFLNLSWWEDCKFTSKAWVSKNPLETDMNSLAVLGSPDSVLIWTTPHGGHADELHYCFVPAFTIYDDEMKNVIGVMALTSDDYAYIYTAEDGYDEHFNFEDVRKRANQAFCEREPYTFERFAYYMTPEQFTEDWFNKLHSQQEYINFVVCDN